MCLTAIGTVVARQGDEAVVRTDDGLLRCSALIAPETLPGDDVLVGLGAILRRLTPDQATAVRQARTSDPEALLEVLS
jgi:HupF/HypC family protein